MITETGYVVCDECEMLAPFMEVQAEEWASAGRHLCDTHRPSANAALTPLEQEQI